MSNCMEYLYQRQSYHYDLPDALIAQQPLQVRDQSKLLLANRTQVLGHYKFYNLVNLIPPEALLVLNNSKVIASRLIGKTEFGGRVELFLLEPTFNPFEWLCLAKPLKKIKIGSRIFFDNNCYAEVIDRPTTVASEVPTIKVRLETHGTPVELWLQQTGTVPLPPYIERSMPKSFLESPDRDTYQTIYAEHSGSAAAPTAGLHFTPHLFRCLRKKGIEFCFTTLHVGSGTFLPVKSVDIRDHRMHSERFAIPSETALAILKAKEVERPIIAVGTTSLRSLEAFARLTQCSPDKTHEYANRLLRTDLFIHPTSEKKYFDPSFATGMITNFHQPESSLLMLVASLMGLDHIKNIYNEAIAHEYRFFSYGDACLFWFAT